MTLLTQLSKRYNLKFVLYEYFPSKGYRNLPLKLKTKSKSYTLIIYRNHEDIHNIISNANEFSEYLHNHNFPSRKIIRTIKGESEIKLNGKSRKYFACLYEYIEGETIPWEAWTRKHLILLGKSMSEIHNIGKDFPLMKLSSVEKVLEQQLKSLDSYLFDHKIQKTLQSKLNINIDETNFKIFHTKLEKILKETKDSSKTTLHMDLVRGNLIFENKAKELKLSGVIDFEKVTKGSSIYDIARTFAFLLTDCKYKTDREIIYNFLYLGYLDSRRTEFNKEFKNDLPILVNFFWIYDFYKFLKHNPYENLNRNEHFVRTVARLRKSRILNN
ncbi:MAG: phosphotransferase [Candidatus Dojkabacteria bacterium]